MRQGCKTFIYVNCTSRPGSIGLSDNSGCDLVVVLQYITTVPLLLSYFVIIKKLQMLR